MHHRISSPEVVKEARKHFGCDDLAYLEFENQGGPGSVAAHWERRMLGNDMMTSDDISNPVFSILTMAFL